MGGSVGSALNGIQNTVLDTSLNPLKHVLGIGGSSGGGGQPFNGVMPNDPMYNSLLNKDNVLGPSLSANFNPDTTALNQLQTNALSTSPSPWAQAQLTQQGLEESGLKNQAQQQAANQGAQARSNLASKYGLSQGASERLATQGERSGQAGLQNVGFQGANTRAAIGTSDAANKQAQLMALPGMQNQLAQGQTQAQEFNLGNTIGQNTLQNANNLTRYGQQMAGYGAAANSNAMANSGGGKK